MRFPNAANGVKKIFTSQVLLLLSAVLMIIALVMIAVTGAAVGASLVEESSIGTGALAAGAGGLIFLLASGVLAFIGIIMYIVGIGRAARDESSFRSASIFLVIEIIATILERSFTDTNPTLAGVFSSISELMAVFATLFVISGIIKLADRLNNSAVSAQGSTILKLIITAQLLALVANLIVTILGGYTASLIAVVIAIIAAVIEIIQYFMSLSYLSKAKKMLAEN